MDRPIGILGATGKVGRSTAAGLRRASVPVRAIVRDPAKAQALADLGCEIAVADIFDSGALVRAFTGLAAVQVICPVNARSDDAPGEMRRSTVSVVRAADTARVPEVLAISDYGAEIAAGTGVTVLFHEFEQHLRRLDARVTFLRSAEQMENWARVLGSVGRTGVLPVMHHPLTKIFPTVCASDVGTVAAELLLSRGTRDVVHVEGPRRYTAHDVADVAGTLLGRAVVAHELPRAEWDTSLRTGGLSPSYAALVTELYEAHNAGRIDARPGFDEIRYGPTDLADALRPLVAERTRA